VAIEAGVGGRGFAADDRQDESIEHLRVHRGVACGSDCFRGGARFGWIFCPGDEVMQVENDYDRDVYNGDFGVVSRIDMEEGELHVDFDGREVTYGFGDLDELVLAYATTIHKSQGSEYPAVVIPLATQHYPMLQRNLVYTGVTRGKRLVVLFGQENLPMAERVLAAQAAIRSSFRDWCAENGVSRDLAEASLAHDIGSKVEKAYNRTALIEQRREVMERWATFAYDTVNFST